MPEGNYSLPVLDIDKDNAHFDSSVFIRAIALGGSIAPLQIAAVYIDHNGCQLQRVDLRCVDVQV